MSRDRNHWLKAPLYMAWSLMLLVTACSTGTYVVPPEQVHHLWFDQEIRVTMVSGDRYRVAGFQMLPDSLLGDFTVWSQSNPAGESVRRAVAHDSIAEVELINPPGARHTFLASATIATALAVALVPYFQEAFLVEVRHWTPSYSCPYLYLPGDKGWTRWAELFPGSIAPPLQKTDWIGIPASARRADQHEVLITNELQELEYLDHLAWATVEHSPGTRVVRDCDGAFLEVEERIQPVGDRWRSSTGTWRRRIEVELPGDTDTDLVLEILARNTWQSERVLADLLSLSEPGTATWVRRLESEPGRLERLERMFSRVAMKVTRKIRGGWEEIIRIPVVGPELPRSLAVRLPAGREDNRIRIEWIPGTWELYSITTSPVIRQLQVTDISPPSSAVDRRGDSVLDRLSIADGTHVIMAPGDTLRVSLPPERAGQTDDVALFLVADGFYLRAADRNRISVLDRMIGAALMDPVAGKGYALGFTWLFLPYRK